MSLVSLRRLSSGERATCRRRTAARVATTDRSIIRTVTPTDDDTLAAIAQSSSPYAGKISSACCLLSLMLRLYGLELETIDVGCMLASRYPLRFHYFPIISALLCYPMLSAVVRGRSTVNPWLSSMIFCGSMLCCECLVLSNRVPVPSMMLAINRSHLSNTYEALSVLMLSWNGVYDQDSCTPQIRVFEYARAHSNGDEKERSIKPSTTAPATRTQDSLEAL